jgi:hypothetical protein
MLRASPVVFVLIASLGAVRYSCAQNVHVPIPPAVAQAEDLHISLPPAVVPGPRTGDARAPTGDDILRQQAVAANSQRQAEIRRDTDKMLQLTAELKDYLQKGQQGVMSIDAIKKAEQIEKLAHSVKSKMKLSY